MNKKEVLEIRKQFSPKNCAITKICGCYVDYEKIYNSRFRLLRKAFENYDCEGDPSYQKFINENVAWLEDYSLYMAIKDSLNGISWIEWPTELKNREKDALAEAREKLTKEVGFYCFQK